MHSTIDSSCDIAIIGAGPAGLFSIFECGLLKMKCHVFDSLNMLGGQCTELYPEKPIYDIPAVPIITGSELITQLQQQIAPFHPKLHLGQQVVELIREDESWKLISSTGTEVRVKVIIIAAGAGAFGPNKPAIKDIDTFEGRGVYYAVKNREQFRGKRLVIAGGGDSAVDWALSLSELAAKIYVVHRRERFRAAPENAAKLNTLAMQGKVELIIPYQLDSLEGDKQGLTAVNVVSFDKQKKTKKLNADALLSFFGLSSKLGPIHNWNLEIKSSKIDIDPTTTKTSIEGILAVGDIAHYPHKINLILTGFAEAAQAAQAAFYIVNPEKGLHFEHSTTLGIPKL